MEWPPGFVTLHSHIGFLCLIKRSVIRTCKICTLVHVRWVRATSHTRPRARACYTSSTLIGGKGGAGPSSLPTTLRRAGGVSMWIQDGCKVDVDCYLASNGSCFMVTWTIFQKSLLGGRPDTKQGDHDTLNAHNHWFILVYHVRAPAWIEIHLK